VRARTHHAGQAGGASPMRDIPRFVEMLDKGQYNAKTLATVVQIEKMLEGYEEVLYRSTVTGIMVA
jgi:Zn-dependent alcohol dehydrogenase